MNSRPKGYELYSCTSCGVTFSRRRDVQVSFFKKNKFTICDSCFFFLGEKLKGLTVDCAHCGKAFKVRNSLSSETYCCEPCETKGLNIADGCKNSTCLQCHKEFNHYSERRYCSVICSTQAGTSLRVGENYVRSNEAQRKSNCKKCKKIFFYSEKNASTKHRRLYCSLGCSVNEIIKIEPDKSVKEKDINEQKCILCASSNDLGVHHINYDKRDWNRLNLIRLCGRCHGLVSNQSSFWEQLFTGLNSGCKIVKKGWGLEVHYCNNVKYCLKNLIFFKDKRFSLHTHNLKSELWLVSCGEFECLLKNENKIKYFKIRQGETLLIEPGIAHQLQAIQNSIITEVSTRDFPEDSIRTQLGD